MTRLLATVVTAFVSISCGSVDDPVFTDGEACLFLQTVFPVDGEPRAYFRTPIDVSFSEPLPESATLELLDTTGQIVPAEVRAEGRVQSLVLEQPLIPGQTYALESRYVCQDQPVVRRYEWTVGEVGSPVQPDVWSGQTYVLDLSDRTFNRWVQPRRNDFGAFISRFVGPKLRLRTVAVNGDVSLTLAVQDVETAEQHLCAEAVQETDTVHQTQNPAFQVGPVDFALRTPVSDVRVDVFDVKVKGSFSPDGTYLGGVSLQMLLDVGPLGDMFGDSQPVCASLASATERDCVPCPRGGSLTCFALEVDNVRAQALESEVLVDVCADEVCIADPDCAD
ncbi:MAG: hypothetical protein AB8H79_06025 [Myxococcota bacterium]